MGRTPGPVGNYVPPRFKGADASAAYKEGRRVSVKFHKFKYNYATVPFHFVQTTFHTFATTVSHIGWLGSPLREVGGWGARG